MKGDIQIRPVGANVGVGGIERLNQILYMMYLRICVSCDDLFLLSNLNMTRCQLLVPLPIRNQSTDVF